MDSERTGHFTWSVFFRLCPGQTRLSFGAILVYCVTSSSRAIHNRHQSFNVCLFGKKINIWTRIPTSRRWSRFVWQTCLYFLALFQTPLLEVCVLYARREWNNRNGKLTIYGYVGYIGCGPHKHANNRYWLKQKSILVDLYSSVSRNRLFWRRLPITYPHH